MQTQKHSHSAMINPYYFGRAIRAHGRLTAESVTPDAEFP